MNLVDWPLFALKITPSLVGIRAPSNTWFFGSIRVNILNGVTVGLAALQGLRSWRADHATLYAAVGHIQLRCSLKTVHVNALGVWQTVYCINV